MLLRVEAWLLLTHMLCSILVTAARENITIAALVYKKDSDKHGYSRSLQLAKQLIENSTDFKQLTDRYDVALEIQDVPDDPVSAVVMATELTLSTPRPIVILGPDLPQLTDTATKALAQRDILMVPFLPPMCLDKPKNHVISSSPAMTALIDAKIAFMKHFSWSRAGVVYDFRRAHGFFTMFTDQLISSLRNRSISVTGHVAIDPTSPDTKTASMLMAEKLKYLKSVDTKIFLAELDSIGTVALFCQAYKLSLNGPDIVWLLSPMVGTLETWMSHWNNSLEYGNTFGCSKEQIKEVANGAFLFESLPIRRDTTRTASGLTAAEYVFKVHEMAQPGQGVIKDNLLSSAYAMDALWAVSTALNNALKSNISLDTSTANMSALTDSIIAELENVNFEGLTGPSSYSDGKRNGIIAIKQLQGKASKLVDIGQYVTQPNQLQLNTSLFWSNSAVPLDHTPKPTKLPLTIANLIYSVYNRDLYGTVRSIQLAKQLIENRTDFKTLTDSYDIQMKFADRLTRAATAVYSVGNMVRQAPYPIVFLGPGQSSLIQPISNLLRPFSTLLVPFSSDDNTVGYVTSASPQTQAIIDAKLALMKHFSWKRAAILFNFRSENGFFTSFVDALTGSFSNITLTGTFGIDPTSKYHVEESTKYIRTKLTALKEADTKIYLVEVAPFGALVLFCEIYKLKLYGPDIVYLLNPRVRTLEYWWRMNSTGHGRIVSCSKDEIRAAVKGAFTFQNVHLKEDDTPTASGMTPSEYIDTLIKMATPTQTQKPASLRLVSGYSFDAFWAVSIALNNTVAKLKKQNKTLEPQKYDITKELSQELDKVTFQGLTGPFHYCKFQKFQPSERQGIILIKQFQEDGSLKNIGEHFSPLEPTDDSTKCQQSTSTLRLFNASSLWPNGRPPIDRSTTLVVILTIEQPVVIAISTATAVGIFLGILFLTFNLVYRKYKFIKLSAPLFNNIIACGCILCLCSVYLFGVHKASPSTFAIVCKARAWTLSVGFSCAFGAMFIKTWRIYKICTNKKLKVKLGPLSDWYLLSLVGAIIFCDLVLLITWEIVDPLQHSVHPFLPVVKHPTQPFTFVANHLNVCSANNMVLWLTLFYVYKGILLLYGLFLAYETRNVIYAHLNDSRVIGICVYNVVVLSIVGAFLSLLFKYENYEVMYVVLSVCIIFPATATICLLLFPKVSYRCKTNNLDDAEIMNGTGRTITMDVASTCYPSEAPPPPRDKSPSTPNVPTVVFSCQNGTPAKSPSPSPAHESAPGDSKSDDMHMKELSDTEQHHDQNRNENQLSEEKR